MNRKYEIYRMEYNLENALARVQKANISAANKKAIINFHDRCFADGLSIPRILFYVNNLTQLAKWLRKDFDKASKQDIISLVKKMEQMDYTAWTKVNFKTTLKKFYKWLRDTEDWPEEVKWIESSRKNLARKLPEDLLTEDEIRKMIDGAEHPRDKALIGVLYESGCRIGEILTLRCKDIKFDKYGTVLMVNGKTGSRRVRIISSTRYLATWIENHPLRNKETAPLWIGIGTVGRNEIINYASANALIRRIAERVGITKKVNPHTFRHSRATHLATHLTEAQMNEYFGWVQGSNMASTYVHLSGRDVDDALLRMHGMAPVEQDKKGAFSPIKCARCNQLNPPTGKFCTQCGGILDIETAMEIEERMKEADGKLSTLLDDEDVQELLIKKMKMLNLA